MLRHLAVIMDGNGRWAESRNLPRTAGHKKGGETAKEILIACAEEKIEYLTLYTFSSENWNRPAEEVSDLMGLLKYYLGKELDTLNKNNVRLKVIGDRNKLDKDIQKKIKDAEKLTSSNTGINLNLALSYGGRQEIIEATKEISRQLASGEIKESDLAPESFSKFLYTKNTPDPDLLIRTGGDQRISNFLLWQCAYTEFYFTETLWPDFNKQELLDAIGEFSGRERRFGNTNIKAVS